MATKIPLVRILCRATIATTFSQELEEVLQRLSVLVESPEVLQRLLKAAVAETLLAAYRERFLANFADALNMQRASKANSTPEDTKATKRAKKTLTDIAQEIATAEQSGHPIGDLKRKLRKAEEQLITAYDKHFGGDLSTGMFRPLALQVLQLMTTVGNLGVSQTGDSVSVGIGYLPALDQIKTPSATPFLTGNPTRSSMNVLWRHLEFGTGIYATKVVTDGANKTSKGRWWYGPRPGRGLQLKGSKGVHAIFDGKGVPYEPDALRFETVFASMFARALLG